MKNEAMDYIWNYAYEYSEYSTASSTVLVIPDAHG